MVWVWMSIKIYVRLIAGKGLVRRKQEWTNKPLSPFVLQDQEDLHYSKRSTIWIQHIFNCNHLLKRQKINKEVISRECFFFLFFRVNSMNGEKHIAYFWVFFNIVGVGGKKKLICIFHCSLPFSPISFNTCILLQWIQTPVLRYV